MKAKVTISRSEWFRGNTEVFPDYWNGILFDTGSGCRCCLGFVANQLCEFQDEEIRGCGLLSDLQHSERGTGVLDKKPPEELVKRVREAVEVRHHSQLGQTLESLAVYVNDNLEITDEVREKLITEIFAEAGIETEWVD